MVYLDIYSEIGLNLTRNYGDTAPASEWLNDAPLR